MQHKLEPEIVRVPGWERYPWLRAGFSTRRTQSSLAVGGREFDLGWHAENDAEVVIQNRVAFACAVAGEPDLAIVTVSQVHGAEVWDLDAVEGPLTTEEGRAVLEGDGLVSAQPGRLLAILTADCAPVLLVDTRTRAIGAFHAGWRGTLAGVVTRGVACMRERYGTRTEDLQAVIGPCIGPCCFQVGGEIRAQFVAGDADAGNWFTASDGGRFWMDLAQANVHQLLKAGLARDAVQSLGLCTACSRTAQGERRFFSYRAEQGQCGRMLSALGVVEA